MSLPPGPAASSPDGGGFAPPRQAQPGYGQPAYAQQPAAPQMAWRTLELDLIKPGWSGYAWLRPTVTIDGYAHSAEWGRQRFTIPADRTVHLQCHITNVWNMGTAAVVVEPWHLPNLEYTAPAQGFFAGDLGAPGTTRAHGRGFQVGLLCVAGVLTLGLLGLMATVIALVIGS